jgi:hypothetical protein
MNLIWLILNSMIGIPFLKIIQIKQFHSVIVTCFITFTLTSINTNTKNSIDFILLWTQSWLIAASISSIFNIYYSLFIQEKKVKGSQKYFFEGSSSLIWQK